MKTNISRLTLDNFKLFYEELEKRVATTKKITTTSSVKRKQTTAMEYRKYIRGIPKSISAYFNKVLKKVKQPRKKSKKLTKAQQKLEREQKIRGILGIGLLLVIVSIAYSTTVIFLGVDSSASRLALLPQVIFALFTLVKAFSKFYK